jgi:hypothetical protein
LGIETIDDEMLRGIINYKDGENHDRITTLGIALMGHYLDTNYSSPLKGKTEVVRRIVKKAFHYH